MARLNQVTPFIPCCDLDRAFAFYTEILGFQGLKFTDDYAYVHREGAALRLLQLDNDAKFASEHAQQSAYFDVAQGVDALYASLKDKLDTLPEGRVRAPFNQDYGQREFHVIDKDVTLLFFGEAIRD